MRSSGPRRSAHVAALLATLALAPAARADDATADARERFRAGLARYQAGDVADALRYWEPIYRELGAARGWRLAFNLARAYETLGDFTRAVERYESFLSEVAKRRAAGEPLEDLIVREEGEAQATVREIAAAKARIVVAAAERPFVVQIDGSEARLAGFTAYVAPGRHTLVVDPGTPRERRETVDIAAGQEVIVAPPAAAEPRAATAPPPAREDAAPRLVAQVEHPVPLFVVAVAGGATLVSTIAPILTYNAALDYRDANALSSEPDRAAQESNARKLADYDARKTTYAATLAIPITLAAATVALGAWYVMGAKRRYVPLEASGAPAALTF